VFGKSLTVMGDGGAFMVEIVSDSPAKAAIGEMMKAVSHPWHVPPRQLMWALGAGFDALKLVGDSEFHGLIVAGFKMQAGVMLNGAPVAPVKRTRSDKVERPRDISAMALGENQQRVSWHCLAHQAEELTREIRRTPLARAGVLIELEEGIPVMFAEIRTSDPLEGNPSTDNLFAFLADVFALS